MLQVVLTEAGVQVGVQLPTPQPDLIADPVQLQQVILNLIVNAVDAMREQSERARLLQIDVVADPAGGLRFSVRDNGPGFAPEILSRAFEPYVTTKARGTGLGLAIVKKIIDEHGGEIRVANRETGGAEIRIRLRSAPHQESPAHG